MRSLWGQPRGSSSLLDRTIRLHERRRAAFGKTGTGGWRWRPAPTGRAARPPPPNARAVVEALDSDKPEAARVLAAPLHSADLADLLETLDGARRSALLEATGPDLAPDVLADLDEPVRDRVLEIIDTAGIAAAAAALDTGDAARLIGGLDEPGRRRVLDAMPAAARRLVETVLSWPDDSAGA